ncbi:M43 family zinc metalloprotease [Lewinella sp. LCG006]|uniref:M43 family zinc metalloprotease n=1 Tax=Lewinella sp. LCG006 TaxID=3231911 RepID=UPI00345F3E50
MSPKFLLSLAMIFLSSSFTIGQTCTYTSDYYPSRIIPSKSRTPSPLYVAIVVHIIEQKSQVQPFLSDRQVINQISALNRDYNLKNNEWSGLPTLIKNTIGNANIVFYLARETPDGLPSSGITRTTDYDGNNPLEDVFFTNRGGHDPWPGIHYLNIWVMDFPDSYDGILGFSSSPNDIGLVSDGVVINSRAFGLSPAPFILGRSLVHEIGHYLGLLHPWGHLSGECSEDDGIIDTPIQSSGHKGCPPQENMGCETDDPIYWNFMDYTPDCCMALFTQGQVAVMRHVLQNIRTSLTTYGEQNFSEELPILSNHTISVYPNPAMDYFSIDWSLMILKEGVFIKSILIYDLSGKKVTEISVSPARNRSELCTMELPRGLLTLIIEDSEHTAHYAGKLIRL